MDKTPKRKTNVELSLEVDALETKLANFHRRFSIRTGLVATSLLGLFVLVMLR